MFKRAFLFCCVSLTIAATGCITPTADSGQGAEDGVLTAENNLLGNATFDAKSYLPWTTSFTTPGAGTGKIVDGAFCLEVDNKGVNRWDAQFRHREMVIQRGHRYYIQFKIWSSVPTMAYPKIGEAGPPYAEYWNETLNLTPEPQTVSASFVMNAKDCPTCEFAFHVGGGMAEGVQEPYMVCIDDVMLADPEFIKPADQVDAPIPAVLVNQTGYFPNLAKIATVKTDATAPVEWEILDSTGKTLAKGQTIVHGYDAASGDTVHVIDFTAFNAEGKGYVLKVGEDKSHPFDIRNDIYSKLKYDALHFFYHQRQGIPIEMPYAGDKKWTRPAGHPGDVSVGCLPKDRYFGTLTPYHGCNYKLNVSKGWYDAGDHGKYVVNGGATLWVMLNEYERLKYLGSTLEDFGDSKGNIPEGGNGVPDILDEARWNLEFFLGMQVPDGNDLAGMVHHKVHDDIWTMLGIWPDKDDVTRYLHQPTTTATLNFAAALAMASRIYKEFDADFAKKCLAASEKAWEAAKANPEMYASNDAEHGGGPYDDDQTDDEFYWAASELFITTGKDVYKDFLTKSRHYKNVPAIIIGDQVAGTYTWKEVQPLGSMSLAVVPNKLAKDEIKSIQDNIVNAGETYLKIIAGEGYRLPLAVTREGGLYPWGSNSNVINSLLVISLAYDFSKDPRFLNAVATGFDYIMGRNAMDTTYVTGYGDRPVKNPHHRFWAKQTDASFPEPPPGVLSGGPNSGIQDPCAKAAGLEGCKPAKCYIDHIDSWSTNEITINWNAPLAWVSAFLDEQGPKAGAK